MVWSTPTIKLVLKYWETKGIKDLGANLWNEGKTQEIKNRVLHLGQD